MKILILCIYNETERNNKLINIQREYNVNFFEHINRIKHIESINFDIKYYFVSYKDISEEYELVNDILFIRGVEHHMNILDKTIKSLLYFTKHNDIDNTKIYDFVIRTNISTIINYKYLYNYLVTVPRENIYVGGILYQLNWLDEPFGITNDTSEKYSLQGLYFFQGTCIILSNDVVRYILNNLSKLTYDIIDDVSISLFIKTYIPSAYLTFLNVPKTSEITANKKIYDIDSILYRHKSFNDEEDIKNMLVTVKILNVIL